ncbi:patatin-like phospholipase family protein [Paraburkholderia sediminicola]|uniref:patatin-like phospholipase family protein n=1 Tax=Paraburkholderia sediminicola TaxID=458836 RepID=UPI0038B9D6AB
MAIALEAVGLVISPYNNPFYQDALHPLLEQVLAPAELAAFNQTKSAAPVFVAATNVRDNQRMIFTQPALSIDALRASACLPTAFRAVTIDGVPYWDGGYRQPAAVAARRCRPGPDSGDGQSARPAAHAAKKCARHSGSPDRARIQRAPARA